MSSNPSLRRKFLSIYRVARYSPRLTVSVIVLSVVAALLEGIGLTFIIPILETTREGASSGSTSNFVEGFLTIYQLLNVPFTLEYIVAGVVLVMAVRYGLTFLVDWEREKLAANYVRHLRESAFQRTLDAEVAYFDQEGSDEILNTIVTESNYAARVIKTLVKLVEQSLMSVVYMGIALYISPLLTVGTLVVLGVITLLLRRVLESGYQVGDRVADANERVQTAVQSGTQGIRDVKLFGLAGELYGDFRTAVDQFVSARVRAKRNESAMKNAYEFVSATVVFVLIYAALRFTSLSLGGLAVFLFAMFRLAPRMSTLNNQVYQIEANLPHLVRTQTFIDDLEGHEEPSGGNQDVPDRVQELSFENMTFEYTEDERVLDDFSFSVERGEFIAFVGTSGAGKSTIVSLLTRLYDPISGQILANGTDISRFDIDEWREHVAVVRQDPFIFNETLRFNIKIGNRDASQEEVEQACEIAQITEFLDDLPSGYETKLGEDGVRLSGGQRQRIAIARALLRDCDLLVLDEATSDLDQTLEERVHAGIESMDGDYALLVIAHRLSTVRNADRIYTVDDGQVVESGRHEHLIDNGGQYAELYTRQPQNVSE